MDKTEKYEGDDICYKCGNTYHWIFDPKDTSKCLHIKSKYDNGYRLIITPFCGECGEVSLNCPSYKSLLSNKEY